MGKREEGTEEGQTLGNFRSSVEFTWKLIMLKLQGPLLACDFSEAWYLIFN